MKRLFCRIFHEDRMHPICGVPICRTCLTPWPVRWNKINSGAAGMMTRNARRRECDFRQGDKIPHLTVSSDSPVSAGQARVGASTRASSHPGKRQGLYSLERDATNFVSQGPTANSGEMASLRLEEGAR